MSWCALRSHINHCNEWYSIDLNYVSFPLYLKKEKFKSNDVNLQGLLLTRLKDIAIERHSLFYKNTTIASLDTRKTESEFLTEMAHHTKDLCQALISSTGNKLVLQKNIFSALWQKVPSCMWKFKLGTWLVYFFVCACL